MLESDKFIMLNTIVAECNNEITKGNIPNIILSRYGFLQIEDIGYYNTFINDIKSPYDILSISVLDLENGSKILAIHVWWNRDKTFEVRTDGNYIKFILINSERNKIDSESTKVFYA